MRARSSSCFDVGFSHSGRTESALIVVRKSTIQIELDLNITEAGF